MEKSLQEKLEKELSLKFNLTNSEANIAIKAYSDNKSYSTWLKFINKNSSLLKNKVKPQKRLKELFDTIKKETGEILFIDPELHKEDESDRIRDIIENRIEKKYNNDFSNIISKQFINDINNKKAPWTVTWNADKYINPYSFTSGVPFQGLNELYLTSIQKNVLNSDDPRWLTTRDILKHEFSIREGEKGFPVAFSKTINLDKNGNISSSPENTASQKTVKQMYLLYNASQVNGIPPFINNISNSNNVDIFFSAFKNFITSSGTNIINSASDNILYDPISDTMQLPQKKDKDSYYSSFLYEFSRWAEHKNKLFDNSSTPLKNEISTYLLCKTLNVNYNPLNSPRNNPQSINNNRNQPFSLEILKIIKDSYFLKDYCLDLHIYDNTQKQNNIIKNGVSRSR